MIITFAHYKGGTGKTTSCISVAGYLAKKGKRVLVVDLDPQGNLTSGLGIDKNTLSEHMHHVMNNQKSIKKIILETLTENLHLAPTNSDLALSEITSYKGRKEAFILKNALEEIKDYYDFILIDTPPIHSHFIVNGMVTADKVVIVMDPGIFALEGIHTLQHAFGEFFDKIGVNIDIDTVFITKVPGFSLFRKNPAHIIRDEVSEMVENVHLIPYSDYIYDSQINGIPISHFKEKSKVGKVYNKFAQELIDEMEEKDINNKLVFYK